MKKLVLSAAIASLAGTVAGGLAGSAMAVDVYTDDTSTVTLFGEVRSKFTSEEDDDSGTKFSMSSSKLGVSAKYGLDNGLYAEGLLRFTFDLNESGNVELSKGYITFGSDQGGAVTLGRQGSVHDEMFSYDLTWAFGGDAKNGQDIWGTDMIESGLVLRWSNDNFTIMAQHSTAEATAEEDSYNLGDEGDTRHGNVLHGKTHATLNKTMGIGALWKSDFGLGLSGAYTTANLNRLKYNTAGSCKIDGTGTGPAQIGGSVTCTEDKLENISKTTVKDIDAKSMGVEFSYNMGSLSLAAALFSSEYKANNKEIMNVDYSSFGLSAAYKLPGGINLYSVYDSYEVKDNNQNTRINTGAANERRVKNKIEGNTLAVGADYWPHKQVMTFIELAKSEVDHKFKGEKGDVHIKQFDNTGNFDFAALDDAIKNSKNNKIAIGARVYF